MEHQERQMDPELYDELSRLFFPLGQRSCPLYRRDAQRGGVELVGTGVPIIAGRCAMLLTATHVAEEFRGQNLIVGGSRTMLELPLVSAGFATSDGTTTLDIDVEAIAIPAIAAAEMREFYHFTTAAECGTVIENAPLTLYGLVGCPYTKNRSKPPFRERRITPFFYVTSMVGDLANVMSPGKHELTHFALRFPVKKAMGRGQPVAQAPEPHGISGCGVWKVRWDCTAQKAMSPELVGIGIEYLSESGVFIGTRMSVTALALSSLEKNIEAGKFERTKVTIFRERRPEADVDG